MKKIAAAFLLLIISTTSSIHAAVPRDFAIDLKATVSDISPHIVLSWTQRVQSNITAQKIHRRLKGETTWVKQADLTTTQTTYTDSTAQQGIEYEYWMERNLTGLTPNVAMGYLSAGVKVPEVHARGKLLLVIDDTMLLPLAPEIAQLQLDLSSDGWTVQQITAPRSGTAINTKALITTAYNADPGNVKALYLLGHVPVPYSGNQAPDGHGDHVGAWPADGYYGDMNGTWTDTSVNNTTASRTQNDNIPGDGKFDQINFPSLVELQVGRVDLWNLNRSPSTGATETARLRRYLRKAHDYRHKLGAYAAIPRRTLIRDGFGHAFTSEPFAITGWAGAFSGVGQTPIDEPPSGQWFSPTYAGGQDYLWGHGCGGGSYESASSLGTSGDFGHKPSRVVFTSVFGSYHGDWDADNALMRSVIAGNATSDSLGLTCFWAGRPNWFPHSPGMGETMGHMTRLSMNAGLSGGGSYQPGGSSYQGVHIGLMGDPALRLHAVEPPRRLAGSGSSGQINLCWAASTESGLQGYHVYRTSTPAGPFTKLTTTPQAGTSYTDATVTVGNTYTYLVRTLKLESVPGGSYYNLSVGSALTLPASSAIDAVPQNPTELTLVSQTSSTNTQLSWQDNSTNETGFRVERKTNAAGTFAGLTTLAANTTSYTDPGPFTPGSTYYYRIIATGVAGDSMTSNEISFDAVAGFLEFTASKMKVNKTAGTISINVTRFGGGIGAVSVNCATSNSSAIAGTHYTTTSSTLNWADGEQGIKTFSVPITNTSSPQLPRQFKATLSSPSTGASIALWNSIAVQIEDPTATLGAPWTQSLLGSITDSSPAVSAEGVIGDSTMGGSGITSSAAAEAGHFIYQSRAGDGIMTIQVPTPTPAQGSARFAVMVRASTATGAVMAATVGASAAANHGTKIAYRTSTGGSATLSPSADNNQDTPQWLRLTRAGSTFTAESSIDGSVWTTLGSSTLSAMPDTALWGIFHYSADWAGSSTYLGDYQLATYQNASLVGLPLPATPSALAVGTVTTSAVQLTWTPVNNAAGYVIERWGDNGSFDEFNINSGGTGSFSDTTISTDTAYQYRIRAYNGTGESAWSLPLGLVIPQGDVIANIIAEADATIRYNAPNTPAGGENTITVAGSDVVTSALTPVTKSYLRFDLTGFPAINSATLKLAVVAASNVNSPNYFYGTCQLLSETSDTWDESTIHWNNAPQNNTSSKALLPTVSNLGTLYLTAAPGAGTILSINSNVAAINAGKGSNGRITIAFTPYEFDDVGALDFASREHAILPRPTLTVSYPNPNVRPGFLTATPGAGGILLQWSDYTSNETGFQVERRVINGEWTLLQTLPPNTTSITDTTVLPGVIYDYRIRSTNATGTTSWATTSSLLHTGAATVGNPIWSPDSVTFNHSAAPNNQGYVPTGFTYYPPALNFVSGQTLSTTIRNNHQGWLGMKLTVGATPITIHELGRWVISGNSATHTVKLVDATTSVDLPGGSVAIATAGAAAGFKYVALANPVTLAANTSYYLISQETSGGDQWYDGNSTLTYATSVATINQTVYSGNTPPYTLGGSANNCYVPVAFKYSSVSAPFVSSHTMTTLRNDYSGWLGMEINVGSTAMSVNQLGRWVVAGNSGTHTVKLVNATTGTDLASVSVATAGAPAGQFKYTPLPSLVTLPANSTCYVLSQETAGGDQWYDFTKPATGTASGYQYWLLANGLPMDASNNGNANATPTQDGVPNLVKYALGLNPGIQGSNGKLSYGKVTNAGTDYLTFTYTRPEPAPSGITYIVESSPDLTPASWTTSGLIQIGNTNNGATRTITIRDNTPMTGNSRRFMRLRITQP